MTSMPILDCKPILTTDNSLFWYAPREEADKLIPDLDNAENREKFDNIEYLIGMSPEESAFICGLIRAKKPQKILEVGVNQGGSSVVLLKAIKMLDLDTILHSVDISVDLPAAKHVPEWAPDLVGNWKLKYGRDVSAYLEQIGSDIDFCILDTAHFMPGEVLNFLCILPYLKVGATVIVHDQIYHFDVDHNFNKEIGAPWLISCRVLFDTVVATKTAPNLGSKKKPVVPNIASFVVTEQTYKNVDHILSALMLPWRMIPSRQALRDTLNCLKQNYPQHVIDYFGLIAEKQLGMHLRKDYNFNGFAKHFWITLMQDINRQHKNGNVVFFGAGSYCKTIITEWLPENLHPHIIIDTYSKQQSISSIPVFEFKRLVDLAHSISVIIITSSAFHKEIEQMLRKIELLLHNKKRNYSFAIINPFVLQA